MNDLTALQQHIDTLNAGRENCFLADATHFFKFYGITTPAQLDDHLDWGTFSDVYKDVNGVRPGAGWTLAQAREWLARERQRA